MYRLHLADEAVGFAVHADVLDREEPVIVDGDNAAHTTFSLGVLLAMSSARW